MELHTIIVEVVEHSKTGLIPLSVVRLGSSSSEISCDGQMTVSNKYLNKENQKEGETLSGGKRIFYYYVCTDQFTSICQDNTGKDGYGVDMSLPLISVDGFIELCVLSILKL